MSKAVLAEKVAELGATYGMGVYSDAELLSLATGVKPEEFNMDLRDVFSAPVKGIGRKKRLTLFAIEELAIRLSKRQGEKIEIIHSPEDVARFAMPLLRNEQREHFMVMLLNTKNHILAVPDISIGSLTASVVHPREVFKAAVRHSAAAMILIHNHPSGDPSPSREDINVTQRLVKAGKIMDIPVLDHIIVGHDRFTSMKEKGLLS